MFRRHLNKMTINKHSCQKIEEFTYFTTKIKSTRTKLRLILYKLHRHLLFKVTFRLTGSSVLPYYHTQAQSKKLTVELVSKYRNLKSP